MSHPACVTSFVALVAISLQSLAFPPLDPAASHAPSPIAYGTAARAHSATRVTAPGEPTRRHLDAARLPEAPQAPSPPEGFESVRAFFARYDTGLLPCEIDHLGRVILRESQRTGINPAVVLALIAVESSGDPTALSHAGARGLMQLLPATAQAESDHLGLLWKGDNTLFDPVVNVQLGISYLSQLLQRFGDLDTALVAYNWGPTRIARSVRSGRALPDTYRHRVIKHFATLSDA